MTARLSELASDLIARAGAARRFVVAVAGPPGAGKSTLADNLAAALAAAGESAEVLPMDGFHMDNGLLSARGLLAHKGAPETFDVRGFIDIVKAVRRADEEVLVPVFDRARELAIASARAVSPAHRFIIVEGNYLLLDEGKWRELDGLFDFTILLAPPIAVLEERLFERWRGFGLSEEAQRVKVYDNDLPNGRRVLEGSRPAGAVFEIVVD